MKLNQHPGEIKVDATGALHVAWSDPRGRSGIDYIELERYSLDASYRDPSASLLLHIVEQAKQIEALNLRLSKLEGLLGRLGDAFGEDAL